MLFRTHTRTITTWLRLTAATALMLHAMCAGAQPADSAASSPNLWQRVKDYLSIDGGGHSQEKRIDVLGGPYYNNVWGATLSVLGKAYYRMPGVTAQEQPSSSTLYGRASLKGFWSVGLRGTNLWPDDKARLNYDMELSYEPSYYWGMGYDNGDDDANKTMQHKHKINLTVQGLVRVAHNFYLGPAAKWVHTRAEATQRPWLYEGQDSTQRHLAVGVVGEFDSRDQLDNPARGIYLHLEQTFSPKWLGASRAFATTLMQADWYRSVWTGGTVAAELYGEFNFGHPSWASMAQMGDSYRMRSYYEGRYRDKHMLLVQAELRQHLWGRHHMAVWAGGGTVFHNGGTFGHILPDVGLGYRFAFRRNTLIRLDLGVGRSGETGIAININEAF